MVVEVGLVGADFLRRWGTWVSWEVDEDGERGDRGRKVEAGTGGAFLKRRWEERGVIG